MLTGDLQDNERVYDDQDIVRRLLRERPTGDPYVLVTDTSSPRMPRHTQKPGKSFVDEFECTVTDYKGLLKRYLQYNLDSALPLSSTQNLYFHQISSHHKQADLEAGSILSSSIISRSQPTAQLGILYTTYSVRISIRCLRTTLNASGRLSVRGPSEDQPRRSPTACWT